MKKIILLFVSVFAVNLLFSQGIEFKHISFADAQKLAKKENKAMFVDMYTSWCGPCKYLASDIFPNPKVGDYFNKNFICLKYDAEKDEDGLTLAKTHKVTAYPTLLFIDAQGELVYRFMGVKDVNAIIKEGEIALAAYKSMPTLRKMEKKYEKGERSIPFLNEYISIKSSLGHDCSKLLLDYFPQISDEQMVDSLNRARLESITIYDEELLTRAVNLVISKKSDKFFLPTVRYMSSALSSVANEDNEEVFEKILSLKNRIYEELGGKDNFAMAFMGKATIFLPNEMLRLDYYKAKNKEQKFTTLLQSYLKKVEEKSTALTDEEKAEIKSNLLLSMDDMYLTASLINHLDYYIKLNGEINNQTIAWYWMLTKMYPSCKNGAYIAEKLIEAERKEDAKAFLQFSIENETQKGATEKDDIEKCKELLNSLK